jgi:hypothetical protein
MLNPCSTNTRQVPSFILLPHSSPQMHPSGMPCVPQTAWLNDMHEEPVQQLARCSDWVSSLISVYPNHSPYLSVKQQLQASLICGLEGIAIRDCLSSPPGHAFAYLQTKFTLSGFFFSSSWPCMPFSAYQNSALYDSSESQVLFRTGILCSPGLRVWLCLIKGQLCS